MSFIKGKVSSSYPDSLGKRSKLGGKPEWIQDKESTICTNCNNEMKFVGQIDSIDYGHEIDGKEEYIFGDVGMIYIFFCFVCEKAKAYFQSY